jgi:hypothetical protein
MQVTTNELIYFYSIDPETYEPTLENVMNNYMSCSQMMIDRKQLFAVAYKPNQISFEIYQRMYMHDVQVQCIDTNFEGSKAIEIQRFDLILVTNVDELLWVENKTYQKVGHIHIPMSKTETRENNEIIGLQKSDCENYIAVVSGKNLIMDEQHQSKLIVFKRNPAPGKKSYCSLFKIHK